MANTEKGYIQQLKSGSYRVSVYVGTDPITGKQIRLRETCPDETAATITLGKFLEQAEGHRTPERNVLFGKVLDTYLEVTPLAARTLVVHKNIIRRTIRPVLGDVKARKIGPDTLDALNSHLKRCSRICSRLPRTEHYADGPHECDRRCGPLKDHRTPRPHACDDRCLPHRCTPLKESSRQKVLSIVSAALSLAKRYKWIDENPAESATMPGAGDHEPDPPTPEQAAALLNLAFTEDEEFGLFCWTAFTLGGRRGELLGLRENRIDFAALDFWFRKNYVVAEGQRIEKKPKSGKGRHVSVDPLTCELIRDRIDRRRAEAAALGLEVPPDAFVFSPDPLGAAPWNPDTMTHKYRKFADRVGITSSLKETRSYSATQLLTSGVDLNTVAGRLGHARGSTTLQYYAQFTRPADQHAAGVIPAQLDQLRKKEALRGIFRALPAVTGDLAALAADLGPRVGIDADVALPWLAGFASEFPAASRRSDPPGRGGGPAASPAGPPEVKPAGTPGKEKAKAVRPSECAGCGAPLKQAKAGRPTLYCGNACRQRAFRRNAGTGQR